MIPQLNVAALLAIASKAAWQKTKPIITKDVVFLPVLGFLGIIVLWWVVALANHELMPTPLEALIANLDYILNPFYQRGAGNLGIGWLLISSLRRVLVGFLLGAVVAIPLGFLIGMSKSAMLAFNPIIQIFKPVSPLAWLPIALSIFNLADPSAIFVIFITSLWPTIINTALGVSSVPKDYLDVAQVLEMSRWRIITKNYLACQFALYLHRVTNQFRNCLASYCCRRDAYRRYWYRLLCVG